KAGDDEAAKDTMRHLAGEQDRLAERAKRLQDGLKQQGGAGGDAGKELERQRIAEQMQKSSNDLRSAAQPGATQNASGNTAKSVSKTQQQTAAALDKVADKLASATGARDGESRKLSEQLTRAQELRDRINSLGRDMSQMAQRQPGRENGQASAQKTPGDTGRSGRG